MGITIRPGVVVMDAVPKAREARWTPFHSDGAVFPVGWYACRSEWRGPLLLGSTAGRFDTEADCRFWCGAFNGGTAEEQERARQLARPVPGF